MEPNTGAVVVDAGDVLPNIDPCEDVPKTEAGVGDGVAPVANMDVGVEGFGCEATAAPNTEAAEGVEEAALIFNVGLDAVDPDPDVGVSDLEVGC